MTNGQIANLSDADRALIERYRKVNERLEEDTPEALVDIAEKVAHFGSFASPKQRGFFCRLLADAEADVADPVQGVDKLEVRAEVARLQALVAKLNAANEAVTRQRDALQAEVNQLRAEVKALAARAPGHDLDDATCRTIAERVGKASVDAILSALLDTRRKPSEAEERARVERAAPKGPEKVRPLDLDEAPKALEQGPTGPAKVLSPVPGQSQAPKASKVLDRIKNKGSK